MQHPILQLASQQGGLAFSHPVKPNHPPTREIKDIRAHRPVNMLKKKSVSINKSEDKSIKVQALAEVQPTSGRLQGKNHIPQNQWLQGMEPNPQ